MKNIWTIVCRKSTIEEGTNLISLLDSLEQLDVQLKPNAPKNEVFNIPIENEVVSFWYRDDKTKTEKYSIKIELVDPNNKILNTFLNNIEFPEKIGRMRTRIKSSAVPITVSGIYLYKTYFKKIEEKNYKEASAVPMEVVITSDVSTVGSA